MIDLKQKPESPVTLMGDVADEPRYPLGTQITLDGATLRTLAMGLPQVGDTFTLAAMVEVIAVSKNPNQIEDDKRVELQITHMELGSPENEQQAAYSKVSRMYG